MKLVFINNIKEGEILARDIFANNGCILLKANTKLTYTYIDNLINHGVFYIYIKDSRLDDIKDDHYLAELKQKAFENIPKIFNDLTSDNEIHVNESLKSITNLINYVIDEKTINTNLYEVKAYDNYTYIHCIDTCIMASYLGTALKLNKDILKNLGLAAIFHDIGKIKISNKIINKNSSLTHNEFEEIKKHPIYGHDILLKSGINSKDILNGVIQHHEKLDGTGYPFGLKGNEISLIAKIITLCDIFTAVSANRSYRPRFDPSEAYELILSLSGSTLDESLVQSFKNTFAIYPLGSCLRLSNGIEGYVVKQSTNFPDRPIIRVLYNSKTGKSVPSYEINLLRQTNLTIDGIVY